MSPSTIVAGFTVFPISYYSSATHYIYARAHEGSKKAGATQTWPVGRTLFCVNVPPDATERELSSPFKSAGTIEKVIFDSDAVKVDDVEGDSDSDEEEDAMEDEEVSLEQPEPKRRRTNQSKAPQPPAVIPIPSESIRKIRRTGQSAHVVFLDSSSLQRALIPPYKPRSWSVSDEESVGLSHYLAAHESQRPPLDAVRAHADSAMDLFECAPKIKAKGQVPQGRSCRR